MKKNRILLLLLVVVFAAGKRGSGQTYEEFVKQRQEEFSQFKKEQERAIAAMREDYARYVKQRDKEYSDYLKRDWEKFRVFTGEKPPEMPKPKTIPRYVPEPVGSIKPLVIKTIPVEVKPLPGAWCLVPTGRLPEYVDKEAEGTPGSFSFCGEKIFITYDPAFAGIRLGAAGKQAITEFWDKASAISHQSLTSGLQSAWTKLNLNDYGYYMLAEKASATIYPMEEQQQLRILLSWYLMVRSGYDARLAYSDKQIALLLPSWDMIYGKSYLKIGNLRYFIFTPFDGQEILTYEKPYEAANAPVDFNIRTAMKFTAKPVKKQIPLTWKGKKYNFEVRYDPGVINFYKDYPQMDPEVYFNAAVSVTTKQSFGETFRPVIDGMTQGDAANLLLAFVQNGFAYKTDPEQFGREKFFFAEELFYYPAADCEDRSVLFSYLVNELLSLKTVAFEAPGHIFTGVRFTTDVFGDYTTYLGDPYIVADPTFINAPVGRTMPQINLAKVRIIPVTNRDQAQENLADAAEIAQKAGIRKAGSLSNILTDKDGSIYMTGFFSGTLNLGEFSPKGYLDAQNYVLCKFSRDGKFLWGDHVKCTKNAAGLGMAIDPEGFVYVAGSFIGNMENMQTTGNSDIFLARYTPAGERQWLQKAGFDTLQSDPGLICSVEFSKSGKAGVKRLSEYTASFRDYGLFAGADGAVFNALLSNSLVPAGALALNETATFDYADLLKKETDQFLSRQTNQAVAGLFALTSLIRTTGMVIPGSAIQKTLDKYNPSFRTKCPNIYRQIGKVSLLKNNSNIVTIITEKGSDVTFDKMRISSNAQLRVSILPDGNARIDALSGVKVGKMIVWYPLNFVQVQARTGDMIFDYDSDHAQVKMNMRKDILN